MAELGLFTDPRQLQEALLMQQAKMTPQETINYMALKGGRGLGEAVGGMFGVNVQDPAVARATKLRELGAKYGTTTAEALDKIAADLQATDPQMAMQVAEKANQLRAATSKVKLEEARTKSLTSGAGRLNPQNYTAESWAKYSESGDLNDLRDKPGRGGVTEKSPIGTLSPRDFTPESMQEFLKTVQEGSPDYSVLERVKKEAKPGKPEKELPASLVAKAADLDTKISSLNSSVSKLSAIGSRINGLDLGLIQNYARGGQAWLGINTKDRVDFDSVRRTALQEANNLLLLAKGTQTEGDAQRARDQIADENTWKNKAALKSAFQELRDTHASTLNALKAGRNTLVSQGKGAMPTEAPAQPAGGDNEAKIAKFMSANPNKSREQVVNYMKQKGFLPSNY